jgi:hypothetical protein
VVDHIFPFSEIVEALNYVASGVQFGKVCVTL